MKYRIIERLDGIYELQRKHNLFKNGWFSEWSYCGSDSKLEAMNKLLDDYLESDQKEINRINGKKLKQIIREVYL